MSELVAALSLPDAKSCICGCVVVGSFYYARSLSIIIFSTRKTHKLHSQEHDIHKNVQGILNFNCFRCKKWTQNMQRINLSALMTNGCQNFGSQHSTMLPQLRYLLNWTKFFELNKRTMAEAENRERRDCVQYLLSLSYVLLVWVDLSRRTAWLGFWTFCWRYMKILGRARCCWELNIINKERNITRNNGRFHSDA